MPVRDALVGVGEHSSKPMSTILFSVFLDWCQITGSSGRPPSHSRLMQHLGY
jgi:hypothetical protein